jgi:hypothetical protein
MSSVQGIFVYGLMLSWRINNSHTIVVGQTQQTQAFRLLGVSVHWLEFTVVSLPKEKFLKMKPFSFQTYSIIMVQKSVAITIILFLCVNVSGIAKAYLTKFQKGMYYSGIKIFNNLPH